MLLLKSNEKIDVHFRINCTAICYNNNTFSWTPNIQNERFLTKQIYKNVHMFSCKLTITL